MLLCSVFDKGGDHRDFLKVTHQVQEHGMSVPWPHCHLPFSKGTDYGLLILSSNPISAADGWVTSSNLFNLFALGSLSL